MIDIKYQYNIIFAQNVKNPTKAQLWPFLWRKSVYISFDLLPSISHYFDPKTNNYTAYIFGMSLI